MYVCMYVCNQPRIPVEEEEEEEEEEADIKAMIEEKYERM